MTDSQEPIDPHFLQLAVSLQAGAMQQMGKVASPITGKVERDLDMAKHSIDMLAMIERKMESNLTDDEARLLKHALYELRMNYVDELKKSAPESSPKAGTTDAAAKSVDNEDHQSAKKPPDNEDQN
ncbi:MAG: DUF1844 domain-containing protein [Candidatus Zixiibacteriota bacterium]